MTSDLAEYPIICIPSGSVYSVSYYLHKLAIYTYEKKISIVFVSCFCLVSINVISTFIQDLLILRVHGIVSVYKIKRNTG